MLDHVPAIDGMRLDTIVQAFQAPNFRCPAESECASLKHALAQLYFTLDHVGACVFIKDTALRYIYANQTVCDMFKKPLTEIIGNTDESFFDLSRCDGLRRNDLRALAGERVETEESNYFHNGGKLNFATVKMPMRDDSGRVVALCGISKDVTERRRLEQSVRDQKELLSEILENVDAFVYMKDRHRRYRYVNRKIAELYGLRAEQIYGKTNEDLSRDIDAVYADIDREVIRTGRKKHSEDIVMTEDGRQLHCWSTKIPLFKDGEVDGLIGFAADITDVVRVRNEFEAQARTDALTGALSRRFLMECGRSELERAQNSHQRLGLLLIDLDHLKSINDTWGHAVGDLAIRTVVDATRASLRPGDLLGRIGGDEIVAVLPCAGEGLIAAVAERVRAAVCASVITTPDGHPLMLSASVGAAWSDVSSTIETMLAAADRALYQAKQDGRGCCRAAVNSGRDAGADAAPGES